MESNKLFACKAIAFGVVLGLCGCVSLSQRERNEYQMLKRNDVSLAHPIGGFEAPNSVWGAGLLNILPGFGNFYLAVGDGSDPVQGAYGVVNLLFWPISIIWGAPQAAIDANTLNKRDMLYYYYYDKDGKKAMEDRGLKFE